MVFILNKKIISLFAVSALSLTVLAACGSDDDKAAKQTQTEQSAAVFTGATTGMQSVEILSRGLSEKGAWLAAITKDLDA